MKVGIVGLGNVGAATAMALAMRSRIRELILINRTRGRARGVATDIGYGLALTGAATIADGDYADLEGAAAVIVTAGINEKTGGATNRSDPAGRLRLLGPNVEVYREIVPQIVDVAPHTALVVATDPPDPLAEAARRMAPQARVMSTGTSRQLEIPTAHRAAPRGERALRRCIRRRRARNVERIRMVVRDRRWSACGRDRGGTWHGVHAVAQRRRAGRAVCEHIDHQGTGASQYGIGMVNARIAEAIVGDEHIVIPVGAYNEHYGTTLSLPSVVGRNGVGDVVMPDLSREESGALDRSAGILRDAVVKYVGAQSRP
jgi:L-lactate dehydrogenase